MDIKESRKFYKKITGRLPHHTWTIDRIKEELNKLKTTEPLNEVTAPEISPVVNQTTDPLILQLLAGQQELLSKIVESIDEIKSNRPLTEQEAKAEFDKSLKETHFEERAEYEIYALKHKLPDGSEERSLTGKRFNNKSEAESYGMKEFGPNKFKLSIIKKPKLVKNKDIV